MSEHSMSLATSTAPLRRGVAVVRSGASYMWLQGLVVLGSTATGILLARGTEPSGRGAVAVANLVMAVATIVGGLGLPERRLVTSDLTRAGVGASVLRVAFGVTACFVSAVGLAWSGVFKSGMEAALFVAASGLAIKSAYMITRIQ